MMRLVNSNNWGVHFSHRRDAEVAEIKKKMTSPPMREFRWAFAFVMKTLRSLRLCGAMMRYLINRIPPANFDLNGYV